MQHLHLLALLTSVLVTASHAVRHLPSPALCFEARLWEPVDGSYYSAALGLPTAWSPSRTDAFAHLHMAVLSLLVFPYLTVHSLRNLGIYL